MLEEIARPDDVRRQNRRLVLSSLRQHGSASRTDIAARTGLSPSTVSAITTALISEGIIGHNPDGDPAANRRGRPQIALSLNSGAATVATIELALNLVHVVLFDYRGDVIGEEHRRTPTLDATTLDLTRMMCAMLDRLLEARPAGAGPLLHISMGVQGVTDAGSSSMLWSPITPDGNIGFGDALSKRYGVAVSVANDCSMIAEALRWTDPGHYTEDFAAILLSHGIGMGLYLKGKPFLGAYSSAAEFGHMLHAPKGALCRCGRRGCIEAYASDYAILRRVSGQGEDALPAPDVEPAAFYMVAERARLAEGSEREAFRKAGQAIGSGLRSLFSLIDPVPVALVGPGAGVFDLIEEELRAVVSDTSGWGAGHDLTIRCYPDEHPLILQGCMMTSLLHLDTHHFAPGEAPVRRDIPA
ncbi:ROK family transcriptional regulator [Phyllobacterium sp. 21LDTY02-6]|uniref:ROK family transcriptional regulator n=1 Tax=Phyllobacterium sp. 21LDTY02-6 TaxID=2944903 RepID=UPI002020843A|nr:ROK family transcriptional regulator [Phyllobacterium sp. 21LDTY02-6]MCO4317043.1 ROK family transcriptional regulator [Phyllobacterium sp. 21LDTY02-6]